MKKAEFNESFGAFLRHKRKCNNWSQSRLASELGNNSQNISRIERGQISPTLFWVTKLAKAFEQSLAEFILEYEMYCLNE